MKNFLVTFCFSAVALVATAQSEPYKNPGLSPSERAWDLLKRMTLEEKVSQMKNGSPAIERLGIPAYDWWNEALHGVARAGKATVFPQAIGLAATFDEQAVYETFNMVSDEARAKYHDFQRKGERGGYKGLTFWTPNINIYRDPRWGRGMETYGEDPYLTAQMGLSVVKGLQGDGTGKYDKTHACAKHYAVHSGPEWNRHSFDAKNISQRDLWETYLPAFKTLVTEGKVKEVMCAYNRFEGEPCCSNKQLLIRILREDWGYDDIVVSDCGAIGDFYQPNHHETHPSAAAASADAVVSGTDLECGGSYTSLTEAVKKGLINEEKINESVFRLLRARFQLGMFDDNPLVPWSEIPYSVVECKAHVDKALEMARKSMVLLTNKNNTLPLSKSIRKVAVLGPNANDSVMLWANYNGFPTKSVTILEGIKSKLPAGAVYYEKGCDFVSTQTLISHFDRCSYEGKKGFKATFWNNKELKGTPAATGHFSDPLNFGNGGNTVFMPGVKLQDFSARFESVFTPTQSGEVSFIIAADDGSRMFIDGKEVHSEWHDGASKEKAYNLNAVKGRAYKVVLEYYQAGGEAALKFDIGIKKEINYKEVADKAAEADAIIFVGGLSSALEGEEMPVDLPGFRKGDRTDIDLPPVQEEMLKALKATGKPVIFVVCSGSTLALPWEAENLDAMLQAWYPGQQGGTAVADVLFGDYNPGGRLPLTHYASSSDLPDFEDYNMSNRTYRYFKGKPLFPFGYGLSYTTFHYGKAQADKQTLRVGDGMTLTIPLKNTGTLSGDEVVQVYLRNPGDKEGPIKTLRAFRRVTLKAGQAENIRIELPASTFECFNPATNRMENLPGKYELLYGGTSDEKALQKLTVTLQKQALAQSIKTIYPTKDWVISDYVVTDPLFGAQARPGFDNRVAFQAAIDAAYKNGGGVVYIPAGNYEFRSTQLGTKNVRVRQGRSEEKKDFHFEYVLRLHPGVQLRGDWADPEAHNGKVLGTILEVRVGKDAPNHDGNVESWWNDGQAGNALRTTYTSIADRFIEMNAGTGVTNLSIWYPEQDIRNVRPYPWTLFQTQGDCATIERVTLVNSYNGFNSAPSELHYVLNSNITALNKGIEVHVCTDIGRIEDVRISPAYWANSGLPGAPSLQEATAYTRANATGFQMHRSDWEYVSYLRVSGYKTGVWIGREPGFADAPNAQLYEVHVDNCGNGLYVQDVNPYGILISNSSFGAADGGNAAYFYKDFSTSVQFNGVDFRGPIVSDGSDGVVSFENCTFDRYGDYALKINSGNVLLSQCDFKKSAGHIYLGRDMHTLKSVNSGFKGRLQVDNRSTSARVEVITDKKYAFEPIPKNVKTNIDIQPRPASAIVLKADLPRATGYNNDRPVQDVSARLQSALDAVKAAGGGTLYLPAGRYLVDNPIKVPSGVELRGSWDVQHHTQSGGTAIFTNYDGGAAGESGPSLIQLEANAGIKGITLAQLNIASDGFSVENPRKTPFLIQGQGPKVYIVNVTIAVGDKGIDLASYDTSGHYVDYLGGVPLRAGIWVGGGAEGGFIRNMQFNPHYGSRLPEGGQGYPGVFMMRFVQSNCSALKFADVRNQTIFNNFVYGSVYGIHFLKDAITGKYPGKMTVIGHGSDGCTYSLFVEDADKDTKIVAVNSELVNTKIPDEPVRSYVLMGDKVNTDKVHPNARLILYNSAFWGSPVFGAIINNGIVSFQQANFTRSGGQGIDVRGGKARVYTSYFAQKLSDAAAAKEVYARLGEQGKSIELTNNYYLSGFRTDKSGKGLIYGSDKK